MVQISKAKQIEEELSRQTLMRAILSNCLIRQDGVFYMTSGEARQIYFDLKQITLSPKFIPIIVQELLRILIKKQIPIMEIRSVGGIETGSIPLVSQLSTSIGVRGFYVRKEEKKHALRNIIEGECIEPYILVDDVVTTGYSMNLCQSILQDKGFKPARAKLCIVDRRSTVYEDRNDIKTIFTEDELTTI